MHVVRLSGVLGELDAFQPLAADGAVNASSAVAQHLALSGLKAAASPCADTLAFEYMPADHVTLVEVKRTMATLASGSTRGASFPSCPAHVGAWLARAEANADTGDFLPVPPHHGSADGSAAAAKTAAAGVGDLIGGIGATGSLMMMADDGPAAAPKSATAIAAAVEAAGRRAAGGLEAGGAIGAASGAGGGGEAAAAGDDGSVALVGPTLRAFAGPRGYDAGTLLGSLVVAAAAAAVAEGRAASAAAAASGYTKHIAVQRADVASRRRAEAATGCGALLAGFTGTLLRRLGPREAGVAAETACCQAAAEVVRVVEVAASAAGEAALPVEVSSLRTTAERTACLALASACARLLGSGVSAVVGAALAGAGQALAASAAEDAAIQAGLAVSQAVNAALGTARWVLAVADGAGDDAAGDDAQVALARWFSGQGSSEGVPSGTAHAGDLGAWTLVVIAKPPLAWHVKTRLARELAEAGRPEAGDDAAAVSAALLADTLGSMRPVARDGCGDRVVYTVVPSVRQTGAVPPELQSVVDGGPSPTAWRIAVHSTTGKPGLSEVMAAALREAQARSAGPVAFVGCDMPSLRLADLLPAIGKAWGGQGTLLPAADGGYVALVVPGGVSSRVCFESVDWSTTHTFASQQAAVQADACVGAVGTLSGRVWDDVDNVASLERVALRMGAGSATHQAWVRCKPTDAAVSDAPVEALT